MDSDGATVSFGNAEVELAIILELTALTGPIGEQHDDPCAIFLRFGAQNYTREQVLRIVQLINGTRPDECSMSGADRRLWWD